MVNRNIEINVQHHKAKAWVAQYVAYGVSSRRSISDLLCDAYIAGHTEGTSNAESPEPADNRDIDSAERIDTIGVSADTWCKECFTKPCQCGDPKSTPPV